MQSPSIRKACLCAASSWVVPSGDEIRAVLALGGMSGSGAAKLLGLGQGGGRTVRRWVGQESQIPYAAWAVLCYKAGLGAIWECAEELPER